MIDGKSGSVREVALLTKSIEFVVRSLVKVLVGKISLIRLQELVQASFIEEAESYLRSERPGTDVRLTSLALITGMDTRQLAKQRNSNSYRKPKHLTSEFISSLTPENCMIDLWTSNPRFTDLETGKPLKLNIWGSENSFETLVKESIRSRGITVTSAIERLRQSGLVDELDEDCIQLKSKRLAPRTIRKEIGEIKLGLDAVGHLLSTVHRNLGGKRANERKFFQRGSWTHRLDPANRNQLERSMRDFLENADVEARALLEPFEEGTADDFQLTAGVGFYYFEVEEF